MTDKNDTKWWFRNWIILLHSLTKIYSVCILFCNFCFYVSSSLNILEWLSCELYEFHICNIYRLAEKLQLNTAASTEPWIKYNFIYICIFFTFLSLIFFLKGIVFVQMAHLSTKQSKSKNSKIIYFKKAELMWQNYVLRF